MSRELVTSRRSSRCCWGLRWSSRWRSRINRCGWSGWWYAWIDRRGHRRIRRGGDAYATIRAGGYLRAGGGDAYATIRAGGDGGARCVNRRCISHRCSGLTRRINRRCASIHCSGGDFLSDRFLNGRRGAGGDGYRNRRDNRNGSNNDNQILIFRRGGHNAS